MRNLSAYLFRQSGYAPTECPPGRNFMCLGVCYLRVRSMDFSVAAAAPSSISSNCGHSCSGTVGILTRHILIILMSPSAVTAACTANWPMGLLTLAAKSRSEVSSTVYPSGMWMVTVRENWRAVGIIASTSGVRSGPVTLSKRPMSLPAWRLRSAPKGETMSERWHSVSTSSPFEPGRMPRSEIL